MLGLIGKKIGMTSIFSQEGHAIACTVIEAGPCAVTQVKTVDKDGYQAIQLGFGQGSEKNMTQPLQGHFKKNGLNLFRKTVEFENWDLSIGAEVNISLFEKGDFLDITGFSKGRGFQGGVKRHGFTGVGMQTHGQHNRMRAPGSVGGSSFPSRVFKGVRMAGRMKSKQVTIKNLEVLEILSDRNILIVKGSLPGPVGSYVVIKK